MANTIALTSINRARGQFHGLYSAMWQITASITDTDAISATDTLLLTLAVPGVVLGDMVIGISFTSALSDGTDQVIATATVSAADVVSVQLTADVGAFALDTLNAAVVKILVARPAW